MRTSHGRALSTGIANGIETMPLESTSASKGMGIFGDSAFSSFLRCQSVMDLRDSTVS